VTLCLEEYVLRREPGEGKDEARDGAQKEQVQRIPDPWRRRPYWYASSSCTREIYPIQDAGYEEGPEDYEDRVDILREKRQARDYDVGYYK
jgi:hypothetical protein